MTLPRAPKSVLEEYAAAIAGELGERVFEEAHPSFVLGRCRKCHYLMEVRSGGICGPCDAVLNAPDPYEATVSAFIDEIARGKAERRCPCLAPDGDRLADGRCAVCGRMPGESEAA